MRGQAGLGWGPALPNVNVPVHQDAVGHVHGNVHGERFIGQSGLRAGLAHSLRKALTLA
jgi:hypothetical protein